MSITDPIIPEFHERKNYWILKKGRETFFDEERYMLVFDTQEEAEKYRDEKLLKNKNNRKNKKLNFF